MSRSVSVRRRATGAAITLLLALTTASALSGPALAEGPTATARAGYVNPVSRGFADTYADPSVIRGDDGWWYAYGTTDPLREGETTRHLIPVSRSRDLISWQYIGDAFTEASLPAAPRTEVVGRPCVLVVVLGGGRLYIHPADRVLHHRVRQRRVLCSAAFHSSPYPPGVSCQEHRTPRDGAAWRSESVAPSIPLDTMTAFGGDARARLGRSAPGIARRESAARLAD